MKPREFFLEFSDLCYDPEDCKVTVQEGTDANVEPYEKIHVIEYAAYSRLKIILEETLGDVYEHAPIGISKEQFVNDAMKNLLRE